MNLKTFRKSKKIMLPKDYLAYKLSGVHCSDMSDASGMLLLDVKNRCWSKGNAGYLRYFRRTDARAF